MSEKANKPAYPWCGKFKVGDKVVVCRKVATHTEGYMNSWVPSMDAFIGKEMTIFSVSESLGECHFIETGLDYPLAGLEKVENVKPQVIQHAGGPDKKSPVEHGKMPSDLKGIEEMVKRMTKEIIGEPVKEAPQKSNQGLLTVAGEKYIGMGFNDSL